MDGKITCGRNDVTSPSCLKYPGQGVLLPAVHRATSLLYTERMVSNNNNNSNSNNNNNNAHTDTHRHRDPQRHSNSNTNNNNAHTHTHTHMCTYRFNEDIIRLTYKTVLSTSVSFSLEKT